MLAVSVAVKLLCAIVMPCLARFLLFSFFGHPFALLTVSGCNSASLRLPFTVYGFTVCRTHLPASYRSSQQQQQQHLLLLLLLQLLLILSSRHPARISCAPLFFSCNCV
ncbi:uncharacterized protein LOC115561853 [Drosophila navojoa]|uniref:uncharacterized protein LOC115561853 n=1 Tax=Drosophila navojoa TaxID=7232 RepID=UPI0011BFC774|nr:uncharacterized protein LOC115561853 [Drosophila navojoa]